MRSVLFSKKTKPDPELLALKAELLDAQGDLALAYRQFDQALDPELVESCIYQISAVKARCNYLIRAIKERCPEAAAAFSAVCLPEQRGACGGGRTASDPGGSAPQGGGAGAGACECEKGNAAWT